MLLSPPVISTFSHLSIFTLLEKWKTDSVGDVPPGNYPESPQKE
jgi:hypothetical protein